METLYFAAFASFIFGAFGFIMIRFWIIPIWNYRKIKKRTAAEVNRYMMRLSGETPADKQETGDMAKELRVCATRLSDALDLEVPHWYRLILKNRQESPAEASKMLMKLSATTHPEHIQQQVESIRQSLQLRSS